MRLEERIYVIESTKGDAPERFIDENFIIAINDVVTKIPVQDIFLSTKQQTDFSRIKGHSFIYKLQRDNDGYYLIDKHHKLSFFDKTRMQTYYVKEIKKPIVIFDDVKLNDEKYKNFIQYILDDYTDTMRLLESKNMIPEDEPIESNGDLNQNKEKDEAVVNKESTPEIEPIIDGIEACEKDCVLPEINFEDDDN